MFDGLIRRNSVKAAALDIISLKLFIHIVVEWVEWVG
jgi:hypothetical protein